MHVKSGGTQQQQWYPVAATFLVIFTTSNNRHIKYLQIMTATYISSSIAIFTPQLTFTSSNIAYNKNEKVQYVWPARIDFCWSYAEIGQKIADGQLLFLTL